MRCCTSITGSAGKITNCQIGVFAAYVSVRGLEILEERYRRKSTLITAQLPLAAWHENDRRSHVS